MNPAKRFTLWDWFFLAVAVVPVPFLFLLGRGSIDSHPVIVGGYFGCLGAALLFWAVRDLRNSRRRRRLRAANGITPSRHLAQRDRDVANGVLRRLGRLDIDLDILGGLIALVVFGVGVATGLVK